jgi:hypothetical protein
LWILLLLLLLELGLLLITGVVRLVAHLRRRLWIGRCRDIREAGVCRGSLSFVQERVVAISLEAVIHVR